MWSAFANTKPEDTTEQKGAKYSAVHGGIFNLLSGNEGEIMHFTNPVHGNVFGFCENCYEIFQHFIEIVSFLIGENVVCYG